MSSVAGRFFIDHAAFHIVFHTSDADVNIDLESVQQNLICASFSYLFALMRQLEVWLSVTDFLLGALTSVKHHLGFFFFYSFLP